MLRVLDSFFNRFRKNKNIDNLNDRTTIMNVKDFQVVESYKQLRTNIVFAMSVRNTSVIEISSSYPGEGKSITSANVAIAMAQTGAKVLLIDCDLRKSVQHKIFKVENKLGLSSILGKMATFEDCVHKKVTKNLDLISSGPIPPNPSELIASQNMKNFIEEVKEYYDYIFIDSPPVSRVNDACIIAKYIDGTIIVSSSNEVDIDLAKLTKKRLSKVNANLIGIILNKFKEEDNIYHNYYGYYEEDKKPSRFKFKLKRR